MLLKAGGSCWRVETAGRVGLIMDMADYFWAARDVMGRARRSIHLLNWAFDPDTPFDPEAGDRDDGGRFGPFLRDLAIKRPEVDVRILCWRSALPVAATQNFFPHRAKTCFAGSPVTFRLDGSLPMGACHHQKALIVDDELAFCGGGDIAPDRWDTPAHLDEDPRRRRPNGAFYQSRHETMCVVDGEAARALGALFRLRWVRAAGQGLAPPPERRPKSDRHGGDLWPPDIPVAMSGVRVGIARTEPAWRNHPERREAESLHLAAIAEARRCVYMENQYFASPVMAEALAARLSEPDGPEVVLVSTARSPSWFDRMTMDRTRVVFLRRLMAADRFRRLRAYCPKTRAGSPIVVHSKLAIIDDRLLRIGSANLNNRSTGFDTECDVAFEAEAGPPGTAVRAAVLRFRDALIGHWLGVETGRLSQAVETFGGLGAAIEALDPEARRLTPLRTDPIGPFWGFIASSHLGDPAGPRDSWRPWRRRGELRRQLRDLAQRLEEEGSRAPAADLSPETI